MATAVLFPGQGSQFVGMGRALYDQEPTARAIFEAADAQLGFPLSTICFDGPAEVLTDTAVQQPALYTTSLAAWQVMQERGAASASQPGFAAGLPGFVAGHSLGEFSALTAAGALTFEDGLELVRRRGELMKTADKRQPGGMAAVLGLDVGTVAQICSQVAAETGLVVQVANDNCPGQVVISGHEEALTLAIEQLQASGARRVIRLPISIAAHTPLMASVAREFAAAVDRTPIQEADFPVVGNVSARPLTRIEEIRTELKAQLTSPVAWTGSINYLLDHDVDTFIETGPGDVLLGLVKRIDRRAKRVKFTAGE